jgi:hypothetical protein
MEDLDMLDSLFGRISGRTLCALADGAVAPVQSALEYFRDDFVAAIEHIITTRIKTAVIHTVLTTTVGNMWCGWA